MESSNHKDEISAASVSEGVSNSTLNEGNNNSDRVDNVPLDGIYDEAALLKYVAKLSADDIDRLVRIAQNRYNEHPETTSQSLTDYYDLLKSVFHNNINSVGNSPHTRNQRYEVYDEMDESTSYISSALDILSDDATQADKDGVIIHIKSASSKIETLVSNFIVEYELEERVSKWARLVAKYGDLFVKVEGEYGKGVSYINDTIYPGIIDRRDLNGKLVAFTNNQDTSNSNVDFYSPWDFVHFRHKGDIYKEESNYSRLGLNRDTFDKNLTSAYGQSILRPAIKVYAQLRFVENMLLLSRLTNSIRRNIFLIHVGDATPDKAFETVANYATLLKKDINLNIEDGIYSSAKHTINYDEDIFLPVGDPQNDVRIEQIGGDVNIREQYDLEYLLNKLFSSIKIPKAYLNYEQDLNARATLVQLDIRYARSVSQLQHTIVSGIRRLINIHLAYLGLDPDEVDLEVSLTSVSAIDEETATVQEQAQVQAAQSTWDLLVSMKDTIDATADESDTDSPLNIKLLAEHIMKTQLKLDQSVIDKAFGREVPEEENNLQRVNSSYYICADAHANYPNEEGKLAYQRLRESILQSSEPVDDTIN